MITATLAIIVRDDEVLLGWKKDKPQFGERTWNGPGGKLEPDDKSLLDCMLRETGEEVGIALDAACTEKVAVLDCYAGGSLDCRVHVYRSTRFSGDPCETPAMIPQWFKKDRLPFNDMIEGDDRWYPKAIAGERFRAVLRFRERAKGLESIEILPYEEIAA